MNTQVERSVDHSRFTGLVPVLCLGLLLSGCGLKTYPKPITQAQIPQIQDLKTQVRLKEVELSWSVPERLNDSTKDTGYTLAVLKAELNWGNRNCPDCPAPSQQEAQIIDPARPAPAVRNGNIYTWLDANVSLQKAYRYQIVVRDRNGQPLSSSNPSVIKVIAPPPPLKNLTAASDQRGISLQWKASATKTTPGQLSPGEIQYLVERHSAEGIWDRLTAVPVKGNTFLDSALASSQIYDYRVTPVYVFEDSLVLGESSVFRQVKAPNALPPPPPGNVWVIPVKGALEVHWLKSDGKVEGYHVYRREGKDIIRLTTAPVQNPPYVDQSIKKNVVYSYAVSAVSNQTGQKEGLLSKWAEIRSLLIDQ